MGTFAEIKTVALGQKAQFVRKRGRQRAKQFITEVGLSGAYESFRLDKDTFEVGGHAMGGAAYIDFERYLTTDEDISESTDILLEGIQEALMGEVQKALIASVNAEDRPTKNVYVGAGWDANAMASLISVARAYGGSAVIFAAPEFIAEMGPDAIGQPIFKELRVMLGLLRYILQRILMILLELVISHPLEELQLFSYHSLTPMNQILLLRLIQLWLMYSQLAVKR